MKKLSKISLSQISKKEMEKRELSQVVGGVNCCICGCQDISTPLDNGNANNADNWSGGDVGGYGSGAFA